MYKSSCTLQIQDYGWSWTKKCYIFSVKVTNLNIHILFITINIHECDYFSSFVGIVYENLINNTKLTTTEDRETTVTSLYTPKLLEQVNLYLRHARFMSPPWFSLDSVHFLTFKAHSCLQTGLVLLIVKYHNFWIMFTLLVLMIWYVKRSWLLARVK